MNDREQLLMRSVSERLRGLGQALIDEGWRPELIVFTPDEPGDLARIPGYKVALVVPLDSAPES